ncbi:MAG: hypothetical protein NTV86_08590 [Planctomycetota bacterium]|nr:hypothetical protein [Planctomycetota bacterium]
MVGRQGVCWAAAAVAAAFACADARGGLSVTPAYIEVKLDEGRPSGTFQIGNNGDKPERYRIEATFFAFGKDRELLRPESSPYSLAPWLTFNPKEIVVAPNTSRTIRFIIVPRGTLQPGEYWAGMEIVSLESRTSVGKDDKGREFKIEVVPSILVPIFATFGNVQYKGGMKDVFLRPGPAGHALGVSLANLGQGRLLTTVDYKLLDAAGKAVAEGQVAKSYIFRESELRLDNSLPPGLTLAKGDYTVQLTANAPQLKEPLHLVQAVHWDPPASPPTTQPGPMSRPAAAPPDGSPPVPASPPPPAASSNVPAPPKESDLAVARAPLRRPGTPNVKR